MVAPRRALAAAALAIACVLPAGVAHGAVPRSPFPRPSAPTRAHVRARVAHRRFTACSARHLRRAKARRACLAHRRTLLRHRTPARHHGGPRPTSSVSADTSASAPTPGSGAKSPVASTAPCADGDLMPDPTNLARVNAAALCLVNQVRGEHGLPALVENAKLQSAAQRHTDDMVAQSYFAHVGPGGDDPLSRIQSTGYLSNNSVGYIVGENIAWGTLTLATPSAIVNAWVNSPEHLANILDPAFRDTGMAASSSAPPTMALGQPGSIYTQDFGGLSN